MFLYRPFSKPKKGNNRKRSRAGGDDVDNGLAQSQEVVGNSQASEGEKEEEEEEEVSYHVPCASTCVGVCRQVHVVVYAKKVESQGASGVCIQHVRLAYESFGNGMEELGVAFGDCYMHRGHGHTFDTDASTRQFKRVLVGQTPDDLPPHLQPITDALSARAKAYSSETGKELF